MLNHREISAFKELAHTGYFVTHRVPERRPEMNFVCIIIPRRDGAEYYSIRTENELEQLGH